MTYIYDAPIPYDEEQPYDFSATWGSTGAPPTILPHLSAAMVLQGDGTFAFWQQGTLDEVAQCVEMICGTEQGSRTVVPGFGLPPLVFTLNQNEKAIMAAINTWEDRATVNLNITSSAQDIVSIQINTSLRSGTTS